MNYNYNDYHNDAPRPVEPKPEPESGRAAPPEPAIPMPPAAPLSSERTAAPESASPAASTPPERAFTEPTPPAPSNPARQAEEAPPFWSITSRPEPIHAEPVAPQPPIAPAVTERAPSEPDWREAEYREYTDSRERMYTPSIANSTVYTPMRPTASRDSRAEYRAKDRPEPPSRRRGGFARALCLVIICALIGAASGAGAVWYGLESGVIKLPRSSVVIGRPTVSDSPDGATPTPVAVTGDRLTGPEIYTLATSQVVSISTDVPTQSFFGEPQSNTVYGSGFIISEDGYILTNYHVIQYASDYGYELSVGMRDGTTYPATVVGGEADSDVAIIKIDSSVLSPVTIGSSDTMQVGELIYAVGNPRRLDHTMTYGIISALDREVQVENNASIPMFQISAAVNSGNSGGPVYNDRGEVIGIVSAKYASVGTEGLGFAIPIDDAMRIAGDLIEYGYVSGKIQFGITARTVDADDAHMYNIVVGAYVTEVAPGSCSEKAGIKQSDIITRVGQYPVDSIETLQSIKRHFKAGETAVVEVFRSGETLRLDITFDEAAPAGAE